MTAVNSQDETGKSLLKKIDSMVDSIVVVCKKNTTTLSPTRYTTTMRKKLNKLFLNSPPRKILKTILELEAFTTFTLQSLLDLTSTQVYPVLRFLQEFEIIHRHTKIRGKAAPPVVVFLLDGGREERVSDAIRTHFDLMPSGTVRMLEYYIDPNIIDSIIMKVEEVSLGRSVKKTVVTKLVKDALGTPLNYTMVLDTLSHFRERGWKVVQ